MLARTADGDPIVLDAELFLTSRPGRYEVVRGVAHPLPRGQFVTPGMVEHRERCPYGSLARH